MKPNNSSRLIGKNCWTDRDLATSWGLTQILGATAWELGWHGGPVAVRGVNVNLRLGAHYLRDKILEWGGEIGNLLPLLAYNGGDGAVEAYNAGHAYNLSYGETVLALQRRIMDLH